MRTSSIDCTPRVHAFAPSRWLRLWFTFESGVGRREYLFSGVALAALKYAGDVGMVWRATGRIWQPLDYLSPVSTLLQTRLAIAPAELLPVLGVWSLPFLWIGISMSMRRALDAGRSAWLGLLFFVPGLSYLFIAAMCAFTPMSQRRTSTATSACAVASSASWRSQVAAPGSKGARGTR